MKIFPQIPNLINIFFFPTETKCLLRGTSGIFTYNLLLLLLLLLLLFVAAAVIVAV